MRVVRLKSWQNSHKVCCPLRNKYYSNSRYWVQIYMHQNILIQLQNIQIMNPLVYSKYINSQELHLHLVTRPILKAFVATIIKLITRKTLWRYKKDKLIRSSVKIRDPKTYSQDAFNISCQVLTKDGAVISRSEPHETFIFDEKGSQFAATFFNCPIQNISSQPDTVHKILKY